MAEKEKWGRVDLRGVLVVGATVEELGTIQNILDGGATIEAHENGSVIIRKNGVSKLDVAEMIESAMGIDIDGLDGLRFVKIPTKIRGRRVENIKTRSSKYLKPRS